MKQSYYSPEVQGTSMGEPVKNAPPPPETIIATSTRVGCDGGAGESRGALGHPLVYINLVPDASGQFVGECGYCDRKFVLAAGADTHGH